MQGGHCFNATVTRTGNTHTNTTIDNLSATDGLSVGMGVSGTGVAAGSVIAAINSTSQVTLSKAATATATGVTLTFTGDAFKILLIKASPARNFDHTQSNVGSPGTGASSATNVGTDETSGTGYTTGGAALTNVSPSLPGSPATTATISFSPNPSWVASTFGTTAAIIYNSSPRLGGTSISGRTVAVYDFGGTQTVTSGTFTLVMPSNTGSTAILRVA